MWSSVCDLVELSSKPKEEKEEGCSFCKYLEKGDILYDRHSDDVGICYNFVEINYCPVCGRKLPEINNE